MSYGKNPLSPRNRRGLVTAAATALILIPAFGGFASKSLLRAQTLEKRRGTEFISASASADTPQTQQILSELKILVNPNETVFPGSGNDVWDKWLNEEVVYLITPAERAAFLALTSDAQRQQFVEQFWEKRNPAPGSTPNSFKVQHYRRIAYANDRFRSNDLAGWQTDRGRVYIVLGPPDEIDSHPNPGREEWRYNLRGTPDSVTILFDISGQGRS